MERRSEQNAILSSGLAPCGRDVPDMALAGWWDSRWGQTGGRTSPLGRTWINGAKPLWYQCNNSCEERWACLPVYVRAACKPRKVTRSLFNQERLSAKLHTPLQTPPRSSTALSLCSRPAGRHKQRLASLADHPASVTGAVISSPSLKQALIGVWCNERPPLSCHTGSYCGDLETMCFIPARGFTLLNLG